MSARTFRGKVESPDGAGARSFLEIPPEIVAELGGGKQRPPVRITLKGYTFPTTVAAYSGQYLVPVRREVREAAGVVFDEPIDVTVELDTQPRTVELPPELASLLESDAEARSAFEALSYTHQKEYAEWLTEPKRESTRQRRLEQVVPLLRQGVKTPRSG